MKKKNKSFGLASGRWWEEEDSSEPAINNSNSLLPLVSLKSYDLYCNETMDEENDGKPKGFLPFVDPFDDGGQPKGLFGLMHNEAENLYHTKITEKGDGKPKGFLPFVDPNQLPLTDGKPKGILPFLQRDEYKFLQNIKKKEEPKKEQKKKKFNTIGGNMIGVDSGSRLNLGAIERAKYTLANEVFNNQRQKLFSKKPTNQDYSENSFEFVPVDIRVDYDDDVDNTLKKGELADNLEEIYDEYGLDDEDDKDYIDEEEEDDSKEKDKDKGEKVYNPPSKTKTTNASGYLYFTNSKKNSQKNDSPITRTGQPLKTYPTGLSKSSDNNLSKSNRYSSDFPDRESVNKSGYSDFITSTNLQSLDLNVIHNYLGNNNNNNNNNKTTTSQSAGGYSSFLGNNSNIDSINNVTNNNSNNYNNNISGYTQYIPPVKKLEKANSTGNQPYQTSQFRKSPPIPRKLNIPYSNTLYQTNPKKTPSNVSSESNTGYGNQINIASQKNAQIITSYDNSGSLLNFSSAYRSKNNSQQNNYNTALPQTNTGYSQNLFVAKSTQPNNVATSNFGALQNSNSAGYSQSLFSSNSFDETIPSSQFNESNSPRLNLSGYSVNLNSGGYSPNPNTGGYSQKSNSSGYSNSLGDSPSNLGGQLGSNNLTNDNIEVMPNLELEHFNLLDSSKKVRRDWNEEFQSLMTRVFENDDQAISSLKILCEEFATIATNIGTIIVEELFVPKEMRTIPSVTDSIGGIAGGEKYVYGPEGIFFKFAVDDRGLYGGDEYIMKAAGQELKSLLELMDCRVQGLHFPLMVLIDYRGYRLIAMPLLPIGPDTLIYGSSDGGETIYTEDPAMNARVQLAAGILNLSGHTIWNRSETKSSFIYGPVDLEGHKGRDGRYYILDTARLFPPAVPINGLKGCHLYRLLRPELVKSNPTPLCSDSFSMWRIDNIEDFHRDIVEATNRLEIVVCREAASSVESYFHKLQLKNLNCDEFVILKIALHRRGVNLRCLGKIRSYVQHTKVRKVILTEIVARVAKLILWSRLRNLHTPNADDYKMIVVEYFNLLFGNSEQSVQYWKSGIKNSILKRFMGAISEEERDVNFDIRSKLLLLPLFERLVILCGVKLSGKKELSRMIKHKLDVKFEVRHIEQLLPKEKTIHHIDFAEGTILSKQATSAGEGAEELFVLADQRFAATLARKPDDFRALHNWGLSLAYRATRFKGEKADKLFDLAAQKFQTSLTINPNDAFALFLWGNMLLSRALRSKKQRKKYLIEAIDKYTKSYRLKPTMELLYNWGNVLLHFANLKLKSPKRILHSACKKYKEAVELNTGDCKKAYRNWGVALAKYARIIASPSNAEIFFNDAEEKLKLSLEHKPCESDAEVYFNWGNIHYHRAVFDARNHKFQSSFKQLIFAGEKYLAALENNVYNSNALYNWGKVILLQLHMDSVYYPDKFSIHNIVDMYLGICLSVLKHNTMTLEPIISLCNVSNLEISQKALSCLEKLVIETSGDIQKQAEKALKHFRVNTPRNFHTQFSYSNPSVVLFLQKLESSIPASLQSISKKSKEKPALSDYERLSTLNQIKSEFNVHLRGRSDLYVMKIKYNDPADGNDSIVPDYISEFEDGIPFVSRVIYHYVHSDGNFYFIQEHVPEDRSLAKLRQLNFFKSRENLENNNENTNIWIIKSPSGSPNTSPSTSPVTYTQSLSSITKQYPYLKYISPSSSGIKKQLSFMEDQRGKSFNPDDYTSIRRSRSDASICNQKELLLSKKSTPVPCLSEHLSIFYIAEIIIALEHIHKLGYVYGNLHPNALYLDTYGHICLTKFHFMKENSTPLHLDPLLAPEVIGGVPYSRMADWWSVGVVLYHFLSGELISSEKLYFPLTLNDNARSIISGLLSFDPEDRLGSKGVDEIKNHPFFATVNWENVESKNVPPPFKIGDHSHIEYDGYDFEKTSTIVADIQQGQFHWFSFVNPTPVVEEDE